MLEASKTSGSGEPGSAMAQSPEPRAAGSAAINPAWRSWSKMAPEFRATPAFSAESGTAELHLREDEGVLQEGPGALHLGQQRRDLGDVGPERWCWGCPHGIQADEEVLQESPAARHLREDEEVVQEGPGALHFVPGLVAQYLLHLVREDEGVLGALHLGQQRRDLGNLAHAGAALACAACRKATSALALVRPTRRPRRRRGSPGRPRSAASRTAAARPRGCWPRALVPVPPTRRPRRRRGSPGGPRSAAPPRR